MNSGTTHEANDYKCELCRMAMEVGAGGGRGWGAGFDGRVKRGRQAHPDHTLTPS